MILILCLLVVFLFFLVYFGIKKVIVMLGCLVSFIVNFLLMVDRFFLEDFYLFVKCVICNFLLDIIMEMII